jgi:hypothetical protein
VSAILTRSIDRIGFHPRSKKAEPNKVTLADAHVVIAREHGFTRWTTFAEQIDTILGDRAPKAVWRRVEQAVLAGDAPALDALMREHGPMLRQSSGLSWVGDLRHDGLGNRGDTDSLPDARAIIAAKLHFESWDHYTEFADTLRDPQSLVAQFEAAIDATSPAMPRRSSGSCVSASS